MEMNAGHWTLVGMVVFAYFVPSINALTRGHHNGGAIVALNVFLGWTFLGWVLALVWSCTAIRKPAPVPSSARPIRPPAPPVARGDMKACPVCAEEIRAAAVKCRFCGADQTATAAAGASR